MSAQPQRGRVFGSALIIAGTTIGAGMLALPLASAGLGIVNASLLLIVMWALMAYTALLMLELHQHADADATLNRLAHQFLGRHGQWLASAAILFLLYSLCAAYISGGGGQMQHSLQQYWPQTPSGSGIVLFTLLVAVVVILGTRQVDIINRGLFTLKIVALVTSLVLITPHISAGHLVDMPLQQGLLLAAIPVVFTSFGFHSSIPSIVRYLDLDIASVRRALLWGSSLPLLVYLLWQLASFGSLGADELQRSGSLPDFMQAIRDVIAQPMVASGVSWFADLALATSFLGVSLGLFDFLADTFNANNKRGGRIGVGLITFIPPLLFALYYPEGFIAALGYAAIALAVLALWLPAAMVFQSRRRHPDADYQVIGGGIALALVAACGVVIIVAQLLK
ncbi:tyrosine transporter TyrP [Bacterioplanes sanyensis]|uniref:aromatic amino acid transport family protein n=1 Tax=Bacterioplanes sanyensis TaxID=1249553 RepID=UPI001673B0B8|nr:aromatic amino acid transport family protein [Bacterioplanes sanyensis]GGY34721.1 tyrosine transporter TyrP [Bacterioplanes sanyensis]